MYRIENWILRRIINKRIKQGPHHEENIEDLYKIIFESCRLKFKEDDIKTIRNYLTKRFNGSMQMANKKVFLGGTCNESKWRDQLIPYLRIDYFNPVVDDWTEKHQKEEIKQRKECDIVLYTITPKMTGVYSIAEVVDDSNKRPEKTVFVVLLKDGNKTFDQSQAKSLAMVGKMVEENGGKSFLFRAFGKEQLKILSNYLNDF